MFYDLISIGCLSYDTIIEIPFIPKINSECFIKDILNLHGGSAANVSAYSAFYGKINTGLVSAIGSDIIGDKLLERIKEYNVSLRGVIKVKKCPSTRIYTLKYPDGTRTYLVNIGALNELSVRDAPKDYLRDSKMFYIAPATKRIHEEFIKYGFNSHKLIAFNPGTVYIEQESRDSLINQLEYVDFLFLNKEEAFVYSNKRNIDEAGQVLKEHGVKTVIITQDDFKPGCTLFHNEEKKFFRGFNFKSVGNIGAGDAFAGGFLSNFIKTNDVESAAEIGNLFATYKITYLEMRRKNPNYDDFIQFSKKINFETNNK